MYGDRIMIVLINAINIFFQVLVYLILAKSFMSWFVRNPYGSYYKIYMMIGQITEPIIAPCRKLLSRFGMSGQIDFSPVVAILGLMVINNILVRLLAGFAF